MKKFLSAIVGLLVIAMLGYGFFFVASKIITYITSLNSDIAVAIIAAAGAVFVSVLSVVATKIYESKQLVTVENRENKIPIYDSLILFMQRALANETAGRKPTQDEIVKFVIEEQPKLMIWGSDEVLKSWIEWRRQASNPSTATESLFIYEGLILAIRKDLGHKNKNLKRGDVLSLFVNDIADHMAKHKLKNKN